MDKVAFGRSKYLGKTFKTRNFGDVIVVGYNGNDDVDVEFIETGYKVKTRTEKLRSGSIRDKSASLVRGVGDSSDVVDEALGYSKSYILWNSMLNRCYNFEEHKKAPTYRDCFVSENFKSYALFRDWCVKQVGCNVDGFELDKDILVEGNKIYSEDTCCFVPSIINLQFSKKSPLKVKDMPLGVSFYAKTQRYRSTICIDGKTKHLGYYATPQEAFLVYKQAKEDYIKSLANKWKDQIDPRVYEALLKYQVVIKQ